ncbi:hypothetical protein QZH41_018863 [Actinostola sp. cb2023]|nr:hypothetical protein QZH41_018863 [Actinostola sp. cb2023]
MAAYHCCVPLCTNDSRKNAEISFHSFPTETKRRSEWIIKIRRDPGDSFKIMQHTKVCSAHFNFSDFKKTLTGRNVLLSSAVPTNFCWTQKTVTRPSPSKRRRCSDKDEDHVVNMENIEEEMRVEEEHRRWERDRAVEEQRRERQHEQNETRQSTPAKTARRTPRTKTLRRAQ